MCFRYWKLRHPNQGLAFGSPALADPVFQKGNPTDWIVTSTVPTEALKAAIAKDEETTVDAVQDNHALVQGPRSHLELLIFYAAFGAEQIGVDIPIDGTSIMTYCMGCLPTSRGTISLRSSDSADAPVIDPNYYATEVDRFVMREGWRAMSRAMIESSTGQELVREEILPKGHEQLGSDAPNEPIDARIKMGASTVYRPAGSAGMGTVVDAELKVKGVQGLRVVDASVIPVPLAAHYQVAVFAIAEQVVDLILKDRPH